MVAVLLSHLHPESVRIDGSGGDGGRDVQITTDAGLQAFELKSFTGRMTSGRRQQVERSLARAATLAPMNWTLIVPIDFTIGEDEWFRKLGGTVSFPIERRGLTWLDAQIAERWFIARYFLDHLSDEIVRLAETLNQERAVLAGGAPDAIKRAEALVGQLNEIDPYYRFEITTDGKQSSVKVLPQYKGAERDRPIGGSVRFEFPKDAEGLAIMEAVRQSFDYGTPVRVPAQYVRELTIDLPAGLGGTFPTGVVEIGPSAPGERMAGILACMDPGGSTLAEVPLDMRVVSRGPKGAVLEASDTTGILGLTAKMDVATRRFTISLHADGSLPFYPHEMRPLLRLLDALGPPNVFSIRTGEGKPIASGVVGERVPFFEEWMPEIVEDLALLQWESGMVRKVGPDFTGQELNAVLEAAALIRGETVEVAYEDFSIELKPEAPQQTRESLVGEDVAIYLETNEPHLVAVGGVSYPIGHSVRTELHGRVHPPVATWSELPADGHIVLVPASSNKVTLTLIR
jgi:hypothetical protein